MASQDTQPFQWRYAEFNKDFETRGRDLFFIVVLFCVVLLIILVVLYTSWVCRYHHHHFPTALVRHELHAPPLRPQGLDSREIRAIPIYLHGPKSAGATSNESECCICLGVFEVGDKVKVLPRCGHCFHGDCVDRWLTAHSNCPFCRASLTSIATV